MYQSHVLIENLRTAMRWVGVEFVLIDYGSSDGLKEFVASLPRELSGNLRYYRCEAECFKAPHAKNVAHVASTGDILVNLDFDNFVRPGYADLMRKTVRDGVIFHDYVPNNVQGVRGTYGRIALTRKDFMSLRGYDESFAPMRHQDTDLINRGKAAGMVVKDGDFTASCVDHDRDMTERMQWEAENMAKGKDHHRRVNPDGFGRATLGLLDGSRMEISNPEPFCLVVGLYRGQTPAREAELAEARRRNLANPLIGEIRFVLEDEEARTTADLAHPKARLFDLGHRATYEDLFGVASHGVGRRAIANADIWFDESVKDVRTRPGMILSASYGTAGEDAWFFESPLPRFPCAVELGRWYCEHRMAREAKVAGIEVFRIVLRGMRHEHKSGIRKYLPVAEGPLWHPRPQHETIKVMACVFNYGMAPKALMLRQALSPFTDAHVLSSESPDDPPFEAGPFVHKHPNIHYTGLWNEAIRMLSASDAKAMLVVTSDIEIPHCEYMLERIQIAFQNPDVWEYAPEVEPNDNRHDVSTLKSIPQDPNMKIVPTNEGMLTCLRRELALKVGTVDPVNQFGWGIDVMTGHFARASGKVSVRDYVIRAVHPEHPWRYDHDLAREQGRRMLEKEPWKCT